MGGRLSNDPDAEDKNTMWICHLWSLVMSQIFEKQSAPFFVQSRDKNESAAPIV